MMLRTLIALMSFAALAAPASAQAPVEIAPIGIGDSLQEKADDYGQRELDRLARILTEDLERELAGRLGVNGTVLEVTILDATPNRPTMMQMSRRGLHHSSIAIGGASIEGRLVSANGEILESFSYSWQSHSIDDVVGYGRWSDARRAFDRFSSSVADSLPNQPGA